MGNSKEENYARLTGVKVYSTNERKLKYSETIGYLALIPVRVAR